MRQMLFAQAVRHNASAAAPAATASKQPASSSSNPWKWVTALAVAGSGVGGIAYLGTVLLRAIVKTHSPRATPGQPYSATESNVIVANAPQQPVVENYDSGPTRLINCF